MSNVISCLRKLLLLIIGERVWRRGSFIRYVPAGQPSHNIYIFKYYYVLLVRPMVAAATYIKAGAMGCSNSLSY